MTLWALSRPDILKDAWAFFDHVKLRDDSFSPKSFGALLMECEQRRLPEHEIQILCDLERRACSIVTNLHFSAVVYRVAAATLYAAKVSSSLDTASRFGARQTASFAKAKCIWCTC
eukprot:gnl/TRDRNA2_/TRDRNA2_142199_c0_seq1.p2 gnl/TRDRNA2_/TRDRNA2_142199_c0~~gnl/TRDRNA2_/TRDRNA2_142199_c0_seq1.p2  ORF type:complete len:116 (-),score=10.78 gnl/TRDRNA2_/TRDRNA2_142199_c0_seq1:28-375(-)